MKKVKIALIGTNYLSHAMPVFNSVLKQDDIFEFVGYNFPEDEKEQWPTRAEEFKKYTELSLDEIWNNDEIEAVLIETEEKHLTKYALEAARHQKHIHMEKPGGTSLADFEKLIEEVKRGGKVFHTGYMYRYNPRVKKLMEDINSGELGDIVSVEAQMNCRHLPQNRQWLEGFPGGMMFFLGCHLVDLVLRIKGEPERIIPLNKCTGTGGVTSEDFGMAVFEYKDGVSFIKTNAMEVGGFIRRQLVVTGTKKTVELKPLEINVPGGLTATKETVYDEINNWNCKGESFESEGFDRYDDMMASFAAMVRGEIENPYSYDYELLLYKTLLKCCGR